MIALKNQNGNGQFGTKKYLLDDEEDVKQLPLDANIGTVATVIETGNVYLFSPKHSKWVLQKEAGAGGATAGSTGDSIKTSVVDGAIKAELLDNSIPRSKIDEKFEEDIADLETSTASLANRLNNIDVSQQINDAIDELDLENNYARKANFDVLVGKDTNKSVRSIANEELTKQLIPDNAQEALDTLQEIAEWIQNHPNDVATINKNIQDLKALVGTIPEDSSAIDVIDYVKQSISALKADFDEKLNVYSTIIQEAKQTLRINGNSFRVEDKTLIIKGRILNVNQ